MNKDDYHYCLEGYIKPKGKRLGKWARMAGGNYEWVYKSYINHITNYPNGRYRITRKPLAGFEVVEEYKPVEESVYTIQMLTDKGWKNTEFLPFFTEESALARYRELSEHDGSTRWRIVEQLLSKSVVLGDSCEESKSNEEADDEK